MIKLFLRNDCVSPLTDEWQLDALLQNGQDDVILRCNEPYSKTSGELERAAAAYLTRLLPHDYSANWDKSTVGYQNQSSLPQKLPHMIEELRFRVLLKKRR